MIRFCHRELELGCTWDLGGLKTNVDLKIMCLHGSAQKNVATIGVGDTNSTKFSENHLPNQRYYPLTPGELCQTSRPGAPSTYRGWDQNISKPSFSLRNSHGMLWMLIIFHHMLEGPTCCSLPWPTENPCTSTAAESSIRSKIC